MGYLGFGVTRDVIKPINNKIEAMNNMKPSTYLKEVKKFIGAIYYCHNILPRRPHMLAPLTRLTSIKRKFKWTQVKQDAFKEIKRIMARDTLLTYPDFNETFKIHTDASASQLGAVISQKVKTFAL